MTNRSMRKRRRWRAMGGQGPPGKARDTTPKPRISSGREEAVISHAPSCQRTEANGYKGEISRRYADKIEPYVKTTGTFALLKFSITDILLDTPDVKTSPVL